VLSILFRFVTLLVWQRNACDGYSQGFHFRTIVAHYSWGPLFESALF